MEPEVRVYGTRLWFLLAEMEGRDRAGLVDPRSWTAESLGATRTAHPQEGSPAGLLNPVKGLGISLFHCAT